MAGGALWTFEEDALIADMVAAGSTGPSIVKAFQARFPGKRGPSSIIKRRSQLGLGAGSIPTEVDEKIDVGEDYVRVAASRSIRDPETLFARSGLDPKVWEIVPDSGQMKKWDVPMKIDDEAVVVPCFYVAIKVRKKWAESGLPSPLIVNVSRPKKVKPSESDFVSVHWGDEHFPHQDDRAISILYQIIDLLNPGFVCAHGDVLDCEQLGRWPKDPMHRVGLAEEIEMGATHLGIIKSLTPNAKRVYLLGNHEARLRKSIWALCEGRLAGEILTLPSVHEVLKWEALLGLGDDWETVSYTGGGGSNHYLLFDRLILKHGDIVRAHSGASAKAEYSKYNKGGMSGHTHRRGVYEHRDYNGTQAWWEMGLLGTIREDYVAHADWQQGFNVVTWSADRKQFGVEEIRIHDGVGYFRGKRYEG